MHFVMCVSQFSAFFCLFIRYNLPVVIVVVNNNGIYSGVSPETWKEITKMGDLTSM